MDVFAQLINQGKNTQQNDKKQQSNQSNMRKSKDSSNSPEDITKIFRKILDNASGDSVAHDPEMIRVKNNLLFVLLLLSGYGIYYLIGDFLDVLLIAYIAGIAFIQIRESFTYHITDPSAYMGPNQSLFKRIFKVIIWMLIGFAFPRLRYMLKHPQLLTTMPSVNDYLTSLQKTDSPFVITSQILIGIYIFHLLFGPLIKRLFIKIRPTNKQCARFFFVILLSMAMIALVIIVPTIFFHQITSVGRIIQNTVQQRLGCSILTYEQNQTLPLCSQMISTQNQFLQETVHQFQQQNKTLEQCLVFLQKKQEEYIGQYIKKYKFIDDNIYYYDEVICTWYSFLDKIISYSGIKINAGRQDLHQVFSTGTNLFKLFFGNLAWILSKISNSVFNITTFVTAFLLTVRSKNKHNQVLKLFSENKKQLVYSITSLIQATFLIVLYHFFFSYLILEIFAISPINLIISILLASMAMFPFFRPWLGMLFIISIRILIVQEYYVSIVFVILYYLISEKIYSIHYRKMQMHEIITNMSVLFGIYQYGVAGVIYGPLIVITYQFVYRELFKIYSDNKN